MTELPVAVGVHNTDMAHAISVPDQSSIIRHFSRNKAFGAWQDGVEHVSAEQRERCERAEKLHCLAHISDDFLAEALLGGEFQ